MMANRSQRTSPVQTNSERPHRAKQEVVFKTRHKVGQGLHQEGARDGTGERLRLGHKLRNIGKAGTEPAAPQPTWPSPGPRGTAPSVSEHGEEPGIKAQMLKR